MTNLFERIRWTILQNKDGDTGILAEAIIKEIESTHKIVDPEEITEEMLDACFMALPKNYDPPDPKRRAWHAYKAKHRFSAMVKAVKKVLG